jgi:hypothetical protein
MKWDPTAYGDLRNLKLMSDLLWKPDIVVFNRYMLITNLKYLFLTLIS